MTTQNTDHYHTKEKTDGNKIKQNSDINLINIYIESCRTKFSELTPPILFHHRNMPLEVPAICQFSAFSRIFADSYDT